MYLKLKSTSDPNNPSHKLNENTSFKLDHSPINAPINDTSVKVDGIMSEYYRISTDERFHYEFRYKLNPSLQDDDYRLMLILHGSKHLCINMQGFSFGQRTLSALRNTGYSFLFICSERQTHDVDLPLIDNGDAKYIYLSLQIWMNTIFYPQFKRYPLLYIHAIGHGSHFASLLCRILPIQAQILDTYPSQLRAMIIPSVYDSDMQTRLLLDPTFANWFYFDFCYNATMKDMENKSLCPFQTVHRHFYPVPPTFFTYLNDVSYQSLRPYLRFVKNLRNKSSSLGGKLLTYTQTIQLEILSSVKLDASYMQENFHPWRSKPHASLFFSEHFNSPALYSTNNPARKTCWCSDIDFTYFEVMPNITRTWSTRKRDEYSDYVKEIRISLNALCEKVCGDLMTTHSMAPRNINKTLLWINQMNALRRSLYLDDYLHRSLRIWMYDKRLLLNNSTNFSSQVVDWMNISKEYQMYVPEYYLQDYFQRLKEPEKVYRQHLQWTPSPLLADYFIIPSDLMYFYFHHHPSKLTIQQFSKLIAELNENYFEKLLTNVRTMFPYWTLATQEDQIGANHILIIPGGRNMGILYNKTQRILKNVIQLGFTGIREDLLPPNSNPQYQYRNIRVTYRHQYDVVIPAFSSLKWKRSKFDSLDLLVKNKTRLFYFAGSLQHSITIKSPRRLLNSVAEDLRRRKKQRMTTEIEGKQFDTILIISGHVKPNEYVHSLQSSVFALCPEGFLPWSPRIYESILVGAIPTLLVDNIVLPFERFVDWRSISVKINASNTEKITNFANRIDKFQQYIKQKLESALPYLYAFQWPYLLVGNSERKPTYQPQEDLHGRSENTFHYISLELRCRRLEQWYGLTVEISAPNSVRAQRLACTNHPTICPCHNEQRSVAFQQYI